MCVFIITSKKLTVINIFVSHAHRLSEVLKSATNNNWSNITNDQLHLTTNVANTSTCRLSRATRVDNELDIFLSIFNNDIIDHIHRYTFSDIHYKTARERQQHYATNRTSLMKYIAFLIHMCGSQAHRLIDELKVQDHKLVTKNQYNKVNKQLCYLPSDLFNLINQSFHNVFVVGSNIARLSISAL